MTARRLLQLPDDTPLLLYVAVDGARDPRKGFDLLHDLLCQLRGQLEGLELVVLGETHGQEPENLGVKVHYMDRLHDDIACAFSIARPTP